MLLFSIWAFLKIFGKNSRTKFQYLHELELCKEGHVCKNINRENKNFKIFLLNNYKIH